MKIAVCPGSFDPVTNGHIAVVRRAAKLFDKVIVVVMANFRKPVGLFTVSERVELLKRCTVGMDNVEVDSYGGLLADYAREKGAIAIVKGLRAVSDFEYELQYAMLNQRLDKSIEAIYLMTSSEYSFLSSSMVREIGSLGGDISGMVPDAICSYVKERLMQENNKDK